MVLKFRVSLLNKLEAVKKDPCCTQYLFVFSRLFSSSSSSRSQSDEIRSHDITSQQDLTKLYDSPVESREHVSRPLGGGGGSRQARIKAFWCRSNN